MRRRIAVVWKGGRPTGCMEIRNGVIRRMQVARGKGRTRGKHFSFSSGGAARLEVTVDRAACAPGADAALVTVRTAKNPFSFFLRDVSAKDPIFIGEYGVAVTAATDSRSFEEMRSDLSSRGGRTVLQKIEGEPEESYDTAARHTRDMRCPTWLGLSRDIRIFETGFGGAGEGWHWVKPRFHGHPVTLDETDGKPVRYNFMLGRGAGCVEDVKRHLEEGVLPILHGMLTEADVAYHFTALVTLERRRLTAKTLRGTDCRVANNFSKGIMLTDRDREEIDALLPAALSRDEETVFRLRTEVVNTSNVGRYAWFLNPFPARGNGFAASTTKTTFDGRTGFASFEGDGVFCVSKLNDRPMPQKEVAVLVPPGETATFEFVIPHRPVSTERACALARQDFDVKHAECRRFWKHKLAAAAKIHLPEKRIDEMVHAGLLHLDLVTYGHEPDGPLAATVGVYSPIGSERAPIIQFTDAVGRHDVARRALDYFLERQHDDGQMMNFFGYTIETGGVLWSVGEHWRLTRDDTWVRTIAPSLLKACDYIVNWRRRNKRPDLRGRGYGMVEGKVADPEDPYHSFMLNAYVYAGMHRTAEMLEGIDVKQSRRIAREAASLKRDIRTAFGEMLVKSPVVPLGDGSWVPTCGPWAEATGPLCLHAEKGNWFTHATATARDSLIGPLYLILQEVIDPDEPGADFMMRYHAELMHLRNVAFSQPYYSPHVLLHLARGEVKCFLKAYYNTLASLADRETYTFWEHYTHVSPHKTHEEGWFLMQTRRMLWLEEGDTLRLLTGIPRVWMEDGKRIELSGVASIFGPVTLCVVSKPVKGRIEAKVRLEPGRPPARVDLRLPHPHQEKPVRVTGGAYSPDTETVRIEPFRGAADVVLEF